MQRRWAHRWSVRDAQARADREESHDAEEDEQLVIAVFGHPEGEDYSEAEDETRPSYKNMKIEPSLKSSSVLKLSEKKGLGRS
jgi:hypothetical protein